MKFDLAQNMTSPVYQPSEGVLLRCPTRSTQYYPDRPDDDSAISSMRALWSDSVFREGVYVASPVLADQVNELLSTDPAGAEKGYAKKVQRIHRSLVKYAIRIATRTTPFGTFSGSAMVSLGDEPLVLGKPEEHRKHPRVGFAQVKRLKECLEVECDDIRVQLNPTMHLLPERVAIMLNPRGAVRNVNESVSVRCTEPVRHVLERASRPVLLSTLLATLAEEFPRASRDVLAHFIRELIERGVLLTEMSASVFDENPLERLRGARSAEIDLAAVTATVDVYRVTPVGQGTAALKAVYAELRPDGNAAQEQLQVDLSLAADGQVPAGVAPRVMAAVEVLMRTSLFLPADPELHKHVERFAAAFGETLVPLYLLFDPSNGIGAPAGYPSSPHKTGEWTLPTETENYLQANRRLRATLIERARRSAAQEVSLEAEDVGELPTALGMWPASYDVFTFLDEDDDGLGITIAPIGVTFPAGKVHGRFAYGDEAIHRHLFRMADREKSARPDVLLCEIDYINNRANVNNVAITPSVCDYRLKVTTGDFDDTAKQTSISLADLLVGVDRGRFYLQHASDGRQVVCRTNNLVSPDASADVVRFVEQVSCDGFIRPGWTWGEVAHLVDFLPGVQFGGVTLSAPTWRIPRLAGTPAAQDAQLLRWADDARLPDYVWVGTVDNRLLLHLRDRLHRDLLAREAAGGVEFVSQARPPQRLGIARDVAGNRYATEVVFSATAGQARMIPEPRPLPRYDLDIECERTLVPGAQWWYLRIYNTVDRQNELLAALAAAADLSRDNWFYVRYRDPDDHLRVRVRADDTDIARLCAALRACVDNGTARWFSIDTYMREIERYGGLESMRVAERLFCHESRFLASNLDLCPPPETTRKKPGDDPGVDARLAPYLRDTAELVDHYLIALGLPDELVMQLLDFVVSGYREEFEASSPTLRRAVQPLVARPPSEAAQRAGKILADSLRADAYGLVGTWAAHTVPGQRQLSALQSLLHMFTNRIGFTRQREYQVMFLLRAIKLARTNYKELMADV